jgi:rhodanese-related sulfurtransferase
MRLRRTTASIEPRRTADRFFSWKITPVDVRSDREYRAVHIPCATHVPLAQLHHLIGGIRTDQPVVLLCRSGHRSALAALIARHHGLDAMAVAGGMSAWLATGRPPVWPSETTLAKRSTTVARSAPLKSVPAEPSR